MAYGRYDDTGILPINNRFGSNVVNSRFDLEPTDNLKLDPDELLCGHLFWFPHQQRRPVRRQEFRRQRPGPRPEPKSDHGA